MAKKSKIEKETRQLMESISDLVKRKGDRYKFKTKSKKAIKKIKKTCPHWIFKKGKEIPTVTASPDRPGYWRCQICGAEFPITPFETEQYANASGAVLEMVNQIAFWGVKFGGDKEDTKMFLRLKTDLPRFAKVSKAVMKAVQKRQSLDSKSSKNDILNQFNNFVGFNYR